MKGRRLKAAQQGPAYRVFFRTPDGRRVRRDTNRYRIGPAAVAARLIIEKEYAPVAELYSRG